MKGIDNTVADTISCLEYDPTKNIKDLNNNQQFGNMVMVLMHCMHTHGGEGSSMSEDEVMGFAQSVIKEVSFTNIFANINKSMRKKKKSSLIP